ncbi:MAG: radical SAM protein [Candidatus Omnitrophica bacterium]|nr:radical SAM protein [Candidatus Omnitrophota bacterium]
MKIFLVVPPNVHYIEPYSYVKADKNNSIRPSLGLLYLAAALRKRADINVRIIDCNAEGIGLDALGEIIRKESPDLVGFSVLTFNLLNCLDAARLIRRVSSATKICFGGWHATLYPYETARLECVDFVVVGEGEQTFPELVEYCRKKDPSGDGRAHIKGVGYRSLSGEVIINPPREIVRDLDSLPFPAYDLLDVEKYSNLLACTENSISIMTSRGCPQKCIFCDLRGTPYRFRSPQNILEEIRLWADKGVTEFFIQDDNFTINRRRTIEFCELLIASGLRITYKISSRVDYLDDELLGYLKRSGCYRIYFGVESGSQKTLDYLEKGITVQQIRDVFKAAKKHGIDRCAYIMIGAPEETRQDIQQTVDLVKEIRPEHLHCSICTPMPETHFYKRLLSQGKIKRDYWREFAENPVPGFKTPFCSGIFKDEELRAFQNSIQRAFYMNAGVIFQEIMKTTSPKQFYAKTRMALGVLFRK